MTEQLNPRAHMETADEFKAAINNASHEPLQDDSTVHSDTLPHEEAATSAAQTIEEPTVQEETRPSHRLRNTVAMVAAGAAAVVGVAGGALLLESRHNDTPDEAAAPHKPVASASATPGTPKPKATPTERVVPNASRAVALDPGVKPLGYQSEESVTMSPEVELDFFRSIASDLKAKAFVPLMEHSQKFNGAYVDTQLADQLAKEYPGMAEQIQPYANSNYGPGLYSFTNQEHPWLQPLAMANRMADDSKVYRQTFHFIKEDTENEIKDAPVIDARDLQGSDPTELLNKLSATTPADAIDILAQEAAAGNADPTLPEGFDQLQHVARIDPTGYVPLSLLKKVQKVALKHPQDYYNALQQAGVYYQTNEQEKPQFQTKLLAVGDVNMDVMGAEKSDTELTVATFYQKVTDPDGSSYDTLLAYAFPKALLVDNATPTESEPIRLATLSLNNNQ